MSSTSIRVTETPFGSVKSSTGDDKPVRKFKLTNSQGAEVELISFGAAVTSLSVPDKNGQLQDVVLGFDHIDGYVGAKVRNPYFGAIVGRVTNRIAKGRFSLDGVQYQLTVNNGENHLHGGSLGFSKVVWHPYVHRDGRVTFTLQSPHLEEGYPGNVTAQVTYTWTENNELVVDCKALTDRPTPVSMASHAYFNLAGHESGSEGLYEHRIRLEADRYTPKGPDGFIPTGELANVEGSLFDFRLETRLGDVIQQVPGGYDHNWVAGTEGKATDFNRSLPMVASVHHPPTGRLMRVFSDQPGLQFYSGNFLPADGSLVGKNGTVYSKHGGMCVETQNFPDAVNQLNFPDPVLHPGAVYQRTAVYQFSVQ